MNIVSRISWIIVAGAIGFYLGDLGIQQYYKGLKATGGVILARDIFGVWITPWVVMSLFSLLAWQITSKKES